MDKEESAAREHIEAQLAMFVFAQCDFPVDETLAPATLIKQLMNLLFFAFRQVIASEDRTLLAGRTGCSRNLMDDSPSPASDDPELFSESLQNEPAWADFERDISLPRPQGSQSPGSRGHQLSSSSMASRNLLIDGRQYLCLPIDSECL